MKITGLKIFTVGNPWKNWVFVKLYTDEGIEGLGECTRGLGAKAVEAVPEELTHLILGEDPRNISALTDKIRKALFLAEDPLFMAFVSGIDTACWDITAKACGQPLYRMLGGKTREKVRAYANGWYQGLRDPGFFAERAAYVVEMGYTALKFDPFGTAYMYMDRAEEKKSLSIVAAVRNAVGEDTDIMIEAHDRFSASTAIRLGNLLAEYRPMWFETPVFSLDTAMTNEVARAVRVPVASGERFSSTRELRQLLSGGSVDIVQPEALRIGGISGLMDACAVARSFNAWVAPHNAQSPMTTAASVHVGITAPNILIQECFDDFQTDWAKEVLRGYPKVTGGYLEAAETPGVGVELDESAVQKHPYSPMNCLRLFEPGWEQRRIRG